MNNMNMNTPLSFLPKPDAIQDKYLIGDSAIFLNAVAEAKLVAKSSANVLLAGETGSGKELFSQLIHDESEYAQGPLIAINCSAIPEDLLESELFGHAKGSFTGALQNKEGLFESADRGTLFLDEIGDLSLPLQSKLLRVIDERKVKRVGENHYRAFSCRIISASHKTLEHEVIAGRFRQDLFYRLNVVQISIPPLRERIGDIGALANHFLQKFSTRYGFVKKSLSAEALRDLQDRDWPGNVRELENLIERAVVLYPGTILTSTQLKQQGNAAMSSASMKVSEQTLASASPTYSSSSGFFRVPITEKLALLSEVMNSYIAFAVAKNNGALDRTAKEIGIDRKTLYRKLRDPSPPTAGSYTSAPPLLG